jgi:hypothetical protein
VRERDLASIDELLHHEDDGSPVEAPTGLGVAWLVKVALAAAVLAALLVLALRSAGVGVPYLLAFTGVLAPLVLHRVVRQVAPQPLPRVRMPAGGEEDGRYRWGAMDGLRLGVTGWEIRLDWGTTDAARFARTTQPALVELVDERLRQRHGLTMTSEPARARALLGEPLWAVLRTPVSRPLSPRQVSALVGQIERL